MKRHLKKYVTVKAAYLPSIALAACLTLPLPALAALVNLATAPLATSTTSTVKPNVMFILDNSGSMGWDYLPDWVSNSDPVTGRAYTSTPPLFRNSGFNGVAYNPAVTYTPPVLYNADGTLNTTTYPNIGSPWTAVKNDAYGIQSTSSTNLTTSFPDVEWCTDTTYSNCLRNDNLILPGTVNGVTYATSHSRTSTGTGFVATGDPDGATTSARSFGPYYYTIIPGEYCDAPNLKNCQTTQTASFSYPAAVRWCNSAALTNCQGINSSTYRYPRYPTKFFTPATTVATFTTNQTPGVNSAAAVAPSNGALVISAVARNSTVFLKCGATFIGKSAAWTSSNSTTASTRLAALYTIINNTTVNGYTTACTASPNTTSPTSLSCSVAAPPGASACSSFTLSNITASTNTGPSGGSNAVTGTKATGTITFTNATSVNPTGFSVQVNGTQIMTATTPGALTSSSGMATWVKNNSSLAGYTITASGSTVTITANTVGTAWNINTIAINQNSATPAAYYGSFIRTDIVPGINSYPYPGTSAKAASRSDCIGATCTYAEEMTNFANWWTYYHTRMQAMKTSVSRAFKTLDNRFRVGFSTITETGVANGAMFLGNNTFELAHKNSWFTKLFAQSTPGYTPLRGALSKAGRYYAKRYTGQADPVQYSCQQNFTILSTDGYWNTNAETSAYKNIDLTGALVGDMDGSTTARPMYEGPTASSGSLADIAKYYYDTDLRTSTLGNCAGGVSTDFPLGNPDVCTNNVFVSSTDNNVQQHMTTFTMGLGADGTLDYTTDYLTATSGDYYNLKNGLGSPTVNWPDPINNTAGERIDDLWHAAVNGRGLYFSAKDPDQIVSGFGKALSSITAKLGSSAAAATSTLNPVAGNNTAFVASYTTVKWSGNLEARSINVNTGAVSETATWCVENIAAATCASPGAVVVDTSGSSTIYNCVVPGATASTCASPGVFDAVASTCTTQIANACAGTMPAKVGATADTRTIYTANNSVSPALIPFDSAYAAANPSYFNAAHISALSQWPTLTAAQQTAAAGVNLLNYLRGQNGFEDRAANASANRLYRSRETVLGDPLESQPAFIANPVFSYPYPGYTAYKTAQAGRAGTVFMGVNDGMMHAFAADTGIERWAYVPSMVITNLWKLADFSYSTNHTNYANGSPIISDVCTALCSDAANAVWKTILVAGLNGGGRGYYALDITVPASPVLLWEFTTTSGIGTTRDDDLGYSFGQPIITRKADGTWVVLVTSGYNNSSPGSGTGHLFVLNAGSGAIISKISTGVGSTATPSGLSRIAGWNNEPAGNLAGYVYGGDLLGNVWRFDINSATAAAIGTGSVMKFATLFSDAGGTSPQPITTTPVLGKIAGKRVIFVGTGKYLEISDLSSTQLQTQYAIKDDDATSTLVNPRNTLVNQTITNNPNGTATRLATGNAVNFVTGRGWYVDFPDSGERVSVDSKLVLGTLLVPTIVPSSTVCSPGGYGWLNYFDYKTGGAVNVDATTGTGQISVKYDATIVGFNILYVNGAPKVGIITSNNPTPVINTNVGFGTSAAPFVGKRVIWRELIP